MDIIGKPTINPFIFYSGKISGYIIWALLAFSYCGVEIIPSVQYPVIRSVSVVIIVIGLLFAALSSLTLGKSIRLGLPNEKTDFKRAGLYTISRNPMYVGFNLISIAAMVGIINPIVAILGIYSIIVYHFIILGEERYLRERFGPKYANYIKEVRRYL